MPVKCAAPPVAHAALLIKKGKKKSSFTFAQTARYKCKTGFFLGGNPQGRRLIKSKCAADGSMPQVFSCGKVKKVQGGGAKWSKPKAAAEAPMTGLPDVLGKAKFISPQDKLPGKKKKWAMKLNYKRNVKVFVAAFGKPLEGKKCKQDLCGGGCWCLRGLSRQLARSGWRREVAQDLKGAANDKAGVPEHTLELWSKFFSKGADKKKGKKKGSFSKLGMQRKQKFVGAIFWTCPEALQCEKAKCGSPMTRDALGPNALFDGNAAEGLAYGDELEVACAKGYALDPEKLEDNLYKVKCNRNGQIDIPAHGARKKQAKCVPISCGEAPAVCFSTFGGKTTFGDKLKYQADPGFSLDGTASRDSRSFSVYCKPNGQFRGVQEFQRVSAGNAPTIQNMAKMEYFPADPKCQKALEPKKGPEPVTKWMGLKDALPGGMKLDLTREPSHEKCKTKKAKAGSKWMTKGCRSGCKFKGPWAINIDFGKACTVNGIKYDDTWGGGPGSSKGGLTSIQPM